MVGSIHPMETKRTARGHIVGSYRPPLNGFAYWPEANGFMVVAPSGARMKWHENEDDAIRDAQQRNAEWGV
jgi:hypothetical protein